MITLVNLGLQNESSIFIPNGSISFQLNVDATVVASPFGFVSAAVPVVFQLDADGNILPNAPATAAMIWSNAELNPQNQIGLGTYYLVTLYDQNGARVNLEPMWWQFTEAANATVNISEMTPFATIGGNVIFYPTVNIIPAPTLTTLGGVFANAGSPNEFVTAINTNGSVSLAQPSFANISGQLTNAQLPSPIIFTTISASGLITAQAGLQVGVAGTTSGQITLEGSTSGAVTITAPAIAGTAANPILFSNGINIPAGTAFSINTDTGLSRASAGVIDVGNGTPGNASGTVNAAAFTIGGASIFASPTFTGTVTAAAVSLSGKITTYAGIATVSGGVPIIVAKALLTNQSATITATTIYAIPVGQKGMYRVAYTATITTAAAGSGSSSILGDTNGFQITYTNANGDSVVKTSNPTSPQVGASNTVGAAISGVCYAYAAASTNLQYEFGYSSVGTTPMVYDLVVFVEYLGI